MAKRSHSEPLRDGRDALSTPKAFALGSSGLVALEAFEDSISRFKDALRTAKDTRTLVQYEERALEALGNVEDAMAPQFPFEIPPKYARLPRLMGRATVECELRLNGSGRAKRGLLTLVLDGYNAPLTAGNFMVFALFAVVGGCHGPDLRPQLCASIRACRIGQTKVSGGGGGTAWWS